MQMRWAQQSRRLATRVVGLLAIGVLLRGMAPNNAGRRANYLEIYEPDVLANELQPVLRYGASLFTR